MELTREQAEILLANVRLHDGIRQILWQTEIDETLMLWKKMKWIKGDNNDRKGETKEYCFWDQTDDLDYKIFNISCKSENFFTVFNPKEINFCPWCGRKIKNVG